MSNPNSPHPRTRCAWIHPEGRKRAGQQCGRYCASGLTVCAIHGGANPMLKNEAARRLALARDPAIEVLTNVCERFNEETCPMCGYPDADHNETKAAVAAAKVILDRTGFGPTSKLEIAQTDGAMDVQHWTPEERAELTRLGRELKALKARVKARVTPPAGVNGFFAVPTPKQTM